MEEERWFDEYKSKKMEYINDNNFVDIKSEEKFNVAFNKNIYSKSYNDVGEYFENVGDEVKDIFDSEDFQYIYSIYRHSERIHMDYEQRFYRLR